MRIRNIDFLKGILVVLVILGHVLQGKLQESFWRYSIYAFHMPLFISTAGYLLNFERLGKLTFAKVIGKYLERLIIPWVIAVIAYALLVNPTIFSNLDFRAVAMSFCKPFYHLWFIPGFLSWVSLTWLLLRLGVNRKIFLVVGILISVTSYVLTIKPQLYNSLVPGSHLIDILLYTFRPQFYVFFLLGNFFAENRDIKIKKVEYLGLLAFGILEIYLFFHQIPVVSVLTFFIFNTLLIRLILKAVSKNALPKFLLLEWVGKNSLGLYLWHVVPIIISKSIFTTNNLSKFYLFTILLELMFISIYILGVKSEPLKKYIFGMN